MSQYCDHIDVAFCERDSFEVVFDDAPDYVGFAQAVTSTRILGYFASVEALTEAVPNPNIGDTYGIGEEAPYSLYVYSANGWIDNGVPSGPPGPPGPQGNDGAQGPPGPAAAVTSWAVRYQASASGTTIPTGAWSVNIPEVPDGQFLWTRTQVIYNDGTTTTSYSVVRGAGGGAVTRDAIIDALGYTPADDATVKAELDKKVNHSDALSLEEISASTDLSGKVASAQAAKDLIDYNSATIDLDGEWSNYGKMTFMKKGKVVVAVMRAYKSQSGYAQLESFGTVPAIYRPKETIACLTGNGEYGTSPSNTTRNDLTGLMYIRNDGSIVHLAGGSRLYTAYVSFVYFTN